MPFSFRVRPLRQTRVGWIGVAAVLGIAVIARFWALGRPDVLVFDELYYVRDAITQLAHGYPTAWPDNDPLMGATFSGEASFAVHPPLGKWLIGLGLLVFGDDTGWGWRSGVALCGVLTVAVTMRLGWRMTRSIWVALIAGLLLAIDGVHVVLTRVALLDGFLALFVALGALCMWRDHETVVGRERSGTQRPLVLWRRPWLLAAAAVFGCAAAVKWSGLYALAAFLLLTTARDTWLRVAAARADRSRRLETDGILPRISTWRPWGAAVAQALSTGLLALPVAFAVYLSSWWGWITSAGGWGRDHGPRPVALAKHHADLFAWHSTLSAPHPFQSHPLTWPLALRPTAMYRDVAADGFTAAITPIPNLLVTWGGVLALLVLAWMLARRLRSRARRASTSAGVPTFALAFVLTGYLSGWLPWVLTLSRSAVFQFYTVVMTPFAALALAIVIAHWCGLVPPSSRESLPQTSTVSSAVTREELRGRRQAAALFLVATVALSAVFFPVWSGMPIPEAFWRWHLWLPGWS